MDEQEKNASWQTPPRVMLAAGSPMVPLRCAGGDNGKRKADQPQDRQGSARAVTRRRLAFGPSSSTSTPQTHMFDPSIFEPDPRVLRLDPAVAAAMHAAHMGGGPPIPLDRLANPVQATVDDEDALSIAGSDKTEPDGSHDAVSCVVEEVIAASDQQDAPDDATDPVATPGDAPKAVSSSEPSEPSDPVTSEPESASAEPVDDVSGVEVSGCLRST